MSFHHVPVLFNECLTGLDIKPDGIYLDCTMGGGGHSLGILEKLTTGRLIAVDKDMFAIENAKERLNAYSDKLTVVHDDFKNIFDHFEELGIEKIDGVLADLGVSSPQLDSTFRGFSYVRDAKLDMRMDNLQPLSAYEVINEYEEKRLATIFFEYGEEKFSRKIAFNIIKQRQIKPIETTLELSAIVERCYPSNSRYKFGHPAKRVFQAVRIEVNNELKGLYDFVIKISRKLNENGRICVISFHSLEDRIIKTAFKFLEADCICDKTMPICICDKRKEIDIITNKPMIATTEELSINNRAESAKLRIAKKL